MDGYGRRVYTTELFLLFVRLEQWPFLLPICVAGFVILGAEIMGSERKCVLCV
jgi:hypothetical protein